MQEVVVVALAIFNAAFNITVPGAIFRVVSNVEAVITTSVVFDDDVLLVSWKLLELLATKESMIYLADGADVWIDFLEFFLLVVAYLANQTKRRRILQWIFLDGIALLNKDRVGSL